MGNWKAENSALLLLLWLKQLKAFFLLKDIPEFCQMWVKDYKFPCILLSMLPIFLKSRLMSRCHIHSILGSICRSLLKPVKYVIDLSIIVAILGQWIWILFELVVFWVHKISTLLFVSGRISASLSLHCLCILLLFQTLEGISDIRDESDRTGMRIVIEVSNLTATGNQFAFRFWN